MVTHLTFHFGFAAVSIRWTKSDQQQQPRTQCKGQRCDHEVISHRSAWGGRWREEAGFYVNFFRASLSGWVIAYVVGVMGKRRTFLLLLSTPRSKRCKTNRNVQVCPSGQTDSCGFVFTTLSGILSFGILFSQWAFIIWRRYWVPRDRKLFICLLELVPMHDQNGRRVTKVNADQSQWSKSFIPCLSVESIRATQVNIHFSHFGQRDQHGIIVQHITNRKFLLWSGVFVAAA